MHGLTKSDKLSYNADIMSDGPHRSLPMPKHWKGVAERAENVSFSHSEVGEALEVSLLKDFQGAPILDLGMILGAGEQTVLFEGTECIDQLEQFRQSCRGVMVGSNLIDCAIDAVGQGLSGSDALHKAVSCALKIAVESACNRIDEHQCGEGPQNASIVRKRLREASLSCRYDELATRILDGAKSEERLKLEKRTGLDDGPPLSVGPPVAYE